MTIPWVLIAVGISAITLAVISIYVLRGKGWSRKVDYKKYFSIGVIWIPCGLFLTLIFDNIIIGAWFFIMGLTYLAIGFKNKDKWGRLQEISPEFQRTLTILVGVLIITFVAGILVFEFMLLG